MDYRMNCTVHALANARGISKEEAYAILKAAGRRDNRGFHIMYWLRQQPFAKKVDLTELFKRAEEAERKRREAQGFRHYRYRSTVAGTAVLKALPPGRYIAVTPRHAVALVDGKLVDTAANYKRLRIQSVYRVEPVEPKPVVVPASRVPFSAMIPSPSWQ